MKKLGLLLLFLSGLFSFSYAETPEQTCVGKGGNRRNNACYCGSTGRSITGLQGATCGYDQNTGIFSRESSETLNESLVCATDSLGNEGYYDESKKRCIYCEADIGEILNIDKDGCEHDPNYEEPEPICSSPGLPGYYDKKNNDCVYCAKGEVLNASGNKCENKSVESLPTGHPDVGIKCDMTTLLHGKDCGMDIEDMLNIRRSTPNTTPTEFVQDMVLTATFFIGTMLTIALIVSGLMIIFGGASENTASRGRQGIKYALIGYVLVLCSYGIIRLVQYIAG